MVLDANGILCEECANIDVAKQFMSSIVEINKSKRGRAA